MDEYQKGYSDAQHLIAQKFVQQVLTDYPLSTEWERVASVTGLTKEEIIAAIKEGKKERRYQPAFARMPYKIAFAG